ncbi:MAG TPA: short chain dehydrogenase [Desulfobulbaceae bacterium]|nr:short chain dehydrogenase [Desulfobulbaceae bacterium]
MLDIKGSVAVITGGSGGIGMTLAQKWLELGGKAVIADIDESALAAARQQLGRDVETFVCNVTKEEDNAALAAFAMEKMGAINLVAPFAGIIKDGMMVSPDKETGKVTKKMSLMDFQKVIDINLTGVFLTVRECAEQMINNNCKGLICLVSSTGSLGTAGQINYSSTKAAMSVMPKVITAEFFRRGLADKIRCVAVAPGYVGTAMVKNMNQKALDKILSDVPIGRLIEPEEVATLVCDIYRNEALAGETYFIHGGLRLGSKG